MKKVSYQANITSELNSELTALRTALNLTNSELLEMFLAFYKKPFRSELSTIQKVESEIKKQLSGGEIIKQFSIRMALGGRNSVNANIVSKGMELYESEITAHNKRISESKGIDFVDVFKAKE